MAESLRDYFVRFLFRTDKSGAREAQTAIDGLTRKLEKLGGMSFVLNEITGAIGNITAPFRQFGGFIDDVARQADELGDLSDRTGIATEKLEGYAFMAKLAGTNSETMLTGIRKLETNMGEAAAGGKEAAAHFAKLGVSLHGAGGKLKSVDELLPEVSKAFEKLPTHAQKTALAVKLFGRAGQELLPFLEKGSAAIQQMQEEMAALGGVTSKEFLESASEYADNADKMQLVFGGIKRALAGPFIDAINESSRAFLSWWKAAGAVMRTKIGEWAFQVVTSVKALWSTVKQLSTGLLFLVAALNAPMLAMIGLRALIALVIDDFVNWMAGNDSLIGRMIANWDEWLAELRKSNPIFAEVMRVFGGIIEWLHFEIKELGKEWDIFIANFNGDTFSDIAKGAMDSLTEFLFAPFNEAMRIIDNLLFDTFMGLKKVAQFLGDDASASLFGSKAASVFGGEHKVQPGGVGAALQAGASGGSSTNSATVNAPVNIVVNAQGADGRQIATEIESQVDRILDRAIRQAYNDTVPEAY